VWQRGFFQEKIQSPPEPFGDRKSQSCGMTTIFQDDFIFSSEQFPSTESYAASPRSRAAGQCGGEGSGGTTLTRRPVTYNRNRIRVRCHRRDCAYIVVLPGQCAVVDRTWPHRSQGQIIDCKRIWTGRVCEHRLDVVGTLLGHLPGCSSAFAQILSRIRFGRCLAIGWQLFGQYPESAGMVPGNWPDD
jgi:hypothetical protein